ncbi:hypothetical protein AYI68_g852 [Smittium mucronatum]|uniref:Uncharacterized protein n=1 Tax=Smittium mucronatum TaxID=133383 RepID=A0A1R0H704_9FUNG|nr:hypothetical protein AYI68_g852 [Smittium mucronatum]
MICIYNVFPKLPDIPAALATKFIKTYGMITKHLKKLLTLISVDSKESDKDNQSAKNSGEIRRSSVSDAINNITSKLATPIDQKNKDFFDSDLDGEPKVNIEKKFLDILNESLYEDEFVLFSDIHYIFSLILLESASNNIKALKTKKQTSPFLVYEIIRIRDNISSLTDIELNDITDEISNMTFEKKQNLNHPQYTVELQVSEILHCILDLTDYIIDHINSNNPKTHKESVIAIPKNNETDGSKLHNTSVRSETVVHKNSKTNISGTPKNDIPKLARRPTLNKSLINSLADPKNFFPYINSAMQTYEPRFSLVKDINNSGHEILIEEFSSHEISNKKLDPTNFPPAEKIEPANESLIVTGKITAEFDNQLSTSILLVGWAWFISCKYLLHDQNGNELDKSLLLEEFLDSFV